MKNGLDRISFALLYRILALNGTVLLDFACYYDLNDYRYYKKSYSNPYVFKQNYILKAPIIDNLTEAKHILHLKSSNSRNMKSYLSKNDDLSILIYQQSI